MTRPKLPQCLDCGRCCTHGWAVDVSIDDSAVAQSMIERWPDGTPRPFAGSYIMGTTPEKGCVAFDHNLKKCSIYNDRPKVCHDFQRGGVQCRELL